MTSKTVIAGALGLGAAAIVVAAAVVLLRPGQEPASSPVAGDIAAQPEQRAGDAEARAIMEAAEQLLNRGDDEAAAQQYARARNLYRRSGDLDGQASVSLGLARAAHFTGQSDRARGHYDEAVALFGKAGSAANESRALAARGDLEKDTFNWEDAARYYRAARTVWETVPEPKSDHHVLFRMNDAPQMPQGEAAAREVLKQADLIFVHLGDRELLGDVRTLLASLNWNAGMPGVARGDYANAQTMYRQAGVPRKEGANALEGAKIDILYGRNVEAQRAVETALDAYGRAGDEAGTALARVAEGDLERLQGRMEEAREAYAAAAELLLRGAVHPEAATALLKLGQIDAHLGATDAARGELEEALGRYRERGSAPGEAAAALALGSLVVEGSDTASAATLFDAAVERFAEAGDAAGAGRASLAAAALALGQGDTDTARALYGEGAARFDEADAALGRILASLGLGNAAREAGDADAAAAAYRAAIASFALLAAPVADANRHLGLPPVETLYVQMELPPDEERQIDDLDLDYGPPEIAEEILEQLISENLAAFPDNNAEAHALLAQVEGRLTDAQAYVQGRN